MTTTADTPLTRARIDLHIAAVALSRAIDRFNEHGQYENPAQRERRSASIGRLYATYRAARLVEFRARFDDGGPSEWSGT